jgi:hypothetical protein
LLMHSDEAMYKGYAYKKKRKEGICNSTWEGGGVRQPLGYFFKKIFSRGLKKSQQPLPHICTTSPWPV